MNMQLSVAESSFKGGEWHLVAWLVRDLFFPVIETYFELNMGLQFIQTSKKQRALSLAKQPQKGVLQKTGSKANLQSVGKNNEAFI